MVTYMSIQMDYNNITGHPFVIKTGTTRLQLYQAPDIGYAVNVTLSVL